MSVEPHLTDDQLEEILSRRARGRADLTDNCQIKPALSSHLDNCEQCKARLTAHAAVMRQLDLLQRGKSRGRSSECPSDTVWMEIAVGIFDKDGSAYLEHAAQCDHCGSLLKEAIESASTDSTAEEELFLEQLASTHPEWQRDMVRTLTRANGASAGRARYWPFRVSLSWKGVAAVSGVAAVLCFVVWLGWRILRPEPVDQLLAQAYTERRTLEVRIPGAKYAPLRIERGGDQSNLDKPVSLLHAESLIGESLKGKPYDPNLLDEKGRAELLDGEYDAAIKSFQRGLDFDPNSFPLLADLGAAYYARAESAGIATDFGNSIQKLGEALNLKPHDPTALFNRALACEKVYDFTQAIRDWEDYLSVDPNGEWSHEAREHLDRIRLILKQRKEGTVIPLLNPGEFLAAASAAGSQSKLAAQSERYQDLALTAWLSDAIKTGFTSPSNNPLHAAQVLGRLVRDEHGDPWLSELLANPRNPGLADAIGAVIASESALRDGRYGMALDLAIQARDRFEGANVQAGVFWAQLAAMRAQSSALKFSECVEGEDDSIRFLSETEYGWLKAAILVEQGQCLDGLARLRDAIEVNGKGREIAAHGRFRALELKAIAFGASYALNAGDLQNGFEDLLAGLNTFWRSDLPDSVGENLYACIFDPSESIDWPYVQAYALEEMLTSFPTRDPVDRAVELELLGTAEMRAGDYQNARSALKIASDALASLPDDSAVVLRRAEIALKDAQILLLLGRGDRAIERLAPFQSMFEEASPGRFQAEYFKTLGEAYLWREDDQDAKPLLERALAVREAGLESLKREAEKLAWGRGRAEVYRDLLEIRLRRDTTENAFNWWEWYKGASLRSKDEDRSALPNEPDRIHVAQVRAFTSTMPPGAVLISYAPLRDSIAAFVIHSGSVNVHRISGDPGLESLTRRFLFLCSDPFTDIDTLNQEGRELYRILVEPLDPEIDGARDLRIETDGIIDQIPFELLRTGDGKYLGDKANVTYSAGVVFELQSAARALVHLSPMSSTLIVASSDTSDSSLPVLPDLDQESAEVASHFRRPALFFGPLVERRAILEKLKTAEVFHFAGHGLDSPNRVGLLLGPNNLLTAGDVATVHPRNLQIAVLSACNSANGDNGTIADIDSIARALIAGGAPHVVAARWRVDSAIARQWMGVFYSNLMAGKTPSESRAAAVASIRRDPNFRHPYYWASFVVFGNS